MPAKEIGLMSESDSDQRRRLWAKTSFVISILGWLIIGSALNTIIFNSLPLKIATPEWQLRLITAVLSSSFSILVGATLIVLALLFNTKEHVLQKWQRLICKFAGLYAILMILIIPLQFFFGVRALNNQTIGSFEAVNTLKEVVKGISGFNSEPELRTYLASLPSPPTLPNKFDVAFPVVKQRAIEYITGQINTATSNIETRKSEGLQLFLKEGVRNTAQAILMAAAFSALAYLSGGASNVVTRLFDSLLFDSLL